MTPPTVETQLIASTSKVSPTKREFWLVFSALTILCVVAVTIGNRRYVWFDELFTFNIARSASLQQLWGRELRFDWNPPIVYLTSRVYRAIFRGPPCTADLPELRGILAT